MAGKIWAEAAVTASADLRRWTGNGQGSYFFPFAPGRGEGAADDEDEDTAEDLPCFHLEAPVGVAFFLSGGRRRWTSTMSAVC